MRRAALILQPLSNAPSPRPKPWIYVPGAAKASRLRRARGRRRRAPLTPRLPRAGSRRAAPAHRCHEDWHAEAERQPADAHGHAHSLRERDAGTSESERGGAPWPPAPPAGLWLARMGWMDARGICAERRCPRPQSRTLRGVPGCQVASRRGAQRRGQRDRAKAALREHARGRRRYSASSICGERDLRPRSPVLCPPWKTESQLARGSRTSCPPLPSL